MKTVKVLVAALAAVAIAVPAMAATADISGNMWVRGLYSDGLSGDDLKSRGFDQRLRIFTTAAANENVKMVMGLEVDGIWGRTGAGKQFGTVGADATSLLEMKHLYLDFKVPTLGANVRAGLQGFNVGRGMIINDDATGLQFSMPVAGNNLALTYIRPQANSQTTGTDAANFFAAKYDLKFGDVKVAPYVAYYTEGKALRDLDVMYLGLDLDGKAGNFGYAATAIYNDWDADVADGNGMALFGKVTTKVDTIGLSLEAGYMGDSDAGEFVSLKQPDAQAQGPLVNISEITTGGRFTSNSALVANLATDGKVAADTLYRTNWLYAKLGADMALTKASKVTVVLAHIQEAEGLERTFGQEVNLYYDYAIVPNLNLTLMGAYLLADEDIRDDDVWKTGTMLTYSF